MSFLSAILGKPHQGGTVTPMRSTTEQFNIQEIFGPQAQNLTSLGQFTGGLLSQYQRRPEQLIAGFTPTELRGQQMAIGAPTQDIVGQALTGYGQALQTDPTQNPFFKSALTSTLNPFIRNFAQQVIPGIRSQAVGVGQTGGSREGIAQGIAAQSLLDQIGNIASQMGASAYGQGLQARQGALGFAPQIAQLGLLPAQTLMDVGAQQRAMEQQRLLAPFTLGQTIQDLIGAPTVLGRGESRTETTGEVSRQTGPSKGLLDYAGSGLSVFAPGTSILG